MATTRLRRTFQYPADSDDEDAVEEGMDEQDQETLISTLSTRDTSTTHLYTCILLVLPLAPVLLYIPRLLSLQTAIPSIIAVASLLASAYTLYFLPLPPASASAGSGSSSSSSKTTTTTKHKPPTEPSPRLPSAFTAPRTSARPPPYLSPTTSDIIRSYIIPTNLILCILLAVVELWTRRSWSEGMTIGGGYMPGLIFSMVLWARRELRVVDLGALERLRYRSQ